MLTLWKNSTFLSKFSIILVGLLGIINYESGNILFKNLSYNFDLIANGSQYWRLVSFVLLPSSIEGFLLFAITFIVFVPKLELMFEKRNFPFILFLTILLQGIVSSLFTWDNDFAYCGGEGVSLFILTLFSLFNPKIKIKLSELTYAKGFHFTVLIVSSWFLAKVLNVSLHPGKDLNVAYISMLFGVPSAMIVYLQLRLVNKAMVNRIKTVPPAVKAAKPQPAEIPSAYAIKEHGKKQTKNFNEDFDYYFEENSELNEDKMNEILDKMNDTGKESLSPFELRYLKEYSIRMK